MLCLSVRVYFNLHTVDYTSKNCGGKCKKRKSYRWVQWEEVGHRIQPESFCVGTKERKKRRNVRW